VDDHGYRLVQAVLVVTAGRLGDMSGAFHHGLIVVFAVATALAALAALASALRGTRAGPTSAGPDQARRTGPGPHQAARPARHS